MRRYLEGGVERGREGGRRKKGGERREGGRREEREGKTEGEGKKEGENNGTSDKGKWERGAGIEGEEEGELTWVCDSNTCREGGCTHSLTLSVFSSIPDATTSRGTLMEEG